MTFEWKNGRQLSSLQTADNNVSYKYDSNGMRTQKTDNSGTTYYYYDSGNNLIGMTKGNNTLLFYYDSDGNVTSFKYGGTMYYYVKNLQGDIVKIINQAGTVYASYVYDAWGNIKSVSGDTTLRELNPFRYRGYVYDSESGLYYLQSRYYDPFTGRFINADDTAFIGTTGTVLSCNLFTYCENDPIKYSDNYGFFSIPSWTVSIAIDAIIMAVSGWLHATWMGFMAPIKFMAKKAAAKFFKKHFAKTLLKISNKLIKFAVKAIKWIGKKALAAAFNLKAKMVISILINEPIRIVTACTSVGGLIATILDYFSDKKFNGWIKVW